MVQRGKGNDSVGTFREVWSQSENDSELCEVIIVPVHMKSGQMCKPKTIVYDGIERSFNMTTINSIMRGQDKPINVREAILKSLANNTLDVPVAVSNVSNTDTDDKEESEVEQD